MLASEQDQTLSLVAVILVSLIFGAGLIQHKAHLRMMARACCSFCGSCVAACRAPLQVQEHGARRRAGSAARLPIEQELRSCRLNYALRVLPVAWFITGIFVARLALRLLAPDEHWMDGVATGSCITGWGLMLLVEFTIRRAPATIPVYHSVSMLMVFLIVAPATLHRVSVLPMSHWIGHSFRVWASLLALDLRQVLVSNTIFTLSMLALFRWLDGAAVLEEQRYDGFELLETASCFFTVVIVWATDSILWLVAEGLVSNVEFLNATKVHGQLLRMVCDMVFELDAEGRITDDCPGLSNALFHRPGKLMKGLSFDGLVMEDEKARIRQQLVGHESEESGAAKMIHIRMRDAWGNAVQMQLFHVPFLDVTRSKRHLVGLREFHDLPDMARLPEPPRSAGVKTKRSKAGQAAMTGDHEGLSAKLAAIPGLPILEGSSAFVDIFSRPANFLQLVPGSENFVNWLLRTADETFRGDCDPSVLCFGKLLVGEHPMPFTIVVNFPAPDEGATREEYSVELSLSGYGAVELEVGKMGRGTGAVASRHALSDNPSADSSGVSSGSGSRPLGRAPPLADSSGVSSGSGSRPLRRAPPPLMLPQRPATTPVAVEVTLAQILDKWNLPMARTSCCRLHCAVNSAKETLQLLSREPCLPENVPWPRGNAQCLHCGLLLQARGELPKHCQVCGKGLVRLDRDMEEDNSQAPTSGRQRNRSRSRSRVRL